MPGEGGGGVTYSKQFHTGRLRPRIQLLTLLYTIFGRKSTPPFRIPSTDKSFPLHIPRLELCIPKCAVFEMWSNHKTRMFSRLFHSHTIHLIALLGLWKTEMTNFPAPFQLLHLIPNLWGTPFERRFPVYAIVGSTLAPGPNVTLSQASIKPQKRLNFPVQVHVFKKSVSSAFWLASCGYVLVPGSCDAMRSH